MRIPAPNFTQTPNELFDEWLPILTHVELKVLMVIMRKTFGWHKIRDRISLSQLEKITGSQRTNIIKATKNLEKLGLIFKKVEGKKGAQETYYELIVIDDSNNLYQCYGDTGGGATAAPTKETLQNIKKEINKEKKTSQARLTATPIKLNKEKRYFEGIEESDIKAWKETFTSLNIHKEIKECVEWALTTSRQNYRKSLLTWFRNSQKNHTTPFKEEDKPKLEVNDNEVFENIKMAEDWEKRFQGKGNGVYAINATPNKVIFIMPNNQGFEVNYTFPKQEFKNKCQPALIKLKLIN